MGHFSGDLHLIKSIGEKLFTIGKTYQYYYSDIYHVQVLKGFKSDLASIPALFRVFIPQVGRFDAAAAMHDSLYRNRYVINTRTRERRTITRAEADKIFLQAMKDLGVRYTRRKALYAGVRLGGWSHWNKCQDC